MLRVANLATQSQAAMHEEASANGCPLLLFYFDSSVAHNDFLADGPFAVFAGEANDFSKWLPFSLTTAKRWTTGQIVVKRLLLESFRPKSKTTSADAHGQ